MIDSQIRAQLGYRPFRPFWLETIGGDRIRVEKPEWFYEWPEGRGEFIVLSKGFTRSLNYRDLVESIQVEGPNIENGS